MLKSFGVTLGMSLAIVVLQLAIGLGLAVLVNQRKLVWVRTLFRTAFYLPLLASTAAVSIFMGYLFDYKFGVVNYYLGLLGISNVPWLTSGFGAAATIVLITVWQQAGFTFVLFVAALMSVPTDVLEAAQIDGAGALRTLFRIKVPLISPTILFAAVVALINAMQLFDQPYIMTKGGPGSATTTVTISMYQKGFQNLQFGYGSAIAIILLAAILAITGIAVPRGTEAGVLPMSTIQTHRRPIARIGRIAGIAVLVLAAMVALGPLLWTVTTSLRTPAEAFSNPPQWIPMHPDFSNYSAVFDRIPIGRFFVNSVIVTGLIVVGQTITCTLSGYAFAMVELPRPLGDLRDLPGDHDGPAADDHHPGVRDHPVPRAVGQPDVPGGVSARQRVRHVPDAPVLHADAQGTRRGGPDRRRGPLPDVPADLRQDGRPGDRHPRDPELLRLLGGVLPAADLPADPGQLHAAARAGRPAGNLGTGSISVVLAGVVLAILPSVVLFIVAQRYFIAGITAGASR